MLIIFLALAVTFAAFVVWLAVRFINRRERWARWTLIFAVGSPVLYVGSFGPACWITSRAEVGQTAVSCAYCPLGRMCTARNFMLRPSDELKAAGALHWYASVFATEGWIWSEYFEFDDDGNAIWKLEWGQMRRFLERQLIL
jgi:hypothetical protein